MLKKCSQKPLDELFKVLHVQIFFILVKGSFDSSAMFVSHQDQSQKMLPLMMPHIAVRR